MKKLARVLWLVIAILGPILLVRGMWALQQPWGVQYQKIFALGFFFILWIVSIFFLFQDKFDLTAIEREKAKWLFYCILCTVFVQGGIFIIVTEPGKWIRGVLGIVFFGLCFIYSVKNYNNS